jgi:hypothetical protein
MFGHCHRELSKDTTALKSGCRKEWQKCLKYRDHRSNAKVEERGKSIVFENTDKMEVVCYRVDGGIIGQDSCKCDMGGLCGVIAFIVNHKILRTEKSAMYKEFAIAGITALSVVVYFILAFSFQLIMIR